jgi:aspartate/methionine/tyrosine aminotransferase
MLERTITLLGPSKTESLSGYRLGVVLAPDWVVAGIENIQSITPLCAPAYAQHVLSSWLEVDKEWLAVRMTEFRKLRDITRTIVSRTPWIKWAPQDGTAYAWLDVRALTLSDATVARKILAEAAVLVSPGYQFGSNGIGRFRLCYAQDERASPPPVHMHGNMHRRRYMQISNLTEELRPYHSYDEMTSLPAVALRSCASL